MPATEEKDISLFVEVHMEVIIDDCRQTVNPTMQVGVSACDKDAVEACGTTSSIGTFNSTKEVRVCSNAAFLAVGANSNKHSGKCHSAHSIHPRSAQSQPLP